MIQENWFSNRQSSVGNRQWVGLAGLFLLLVLAVYADPLFFHRNFGGRDLLGYGLPIESVIHDAYARGRLPVWNPWIAGGRPLLANPNSGALYPVRPLLALLPFPLAFRIFPVLHWALAGIGMIALLRAIQVSKGGAWIGAVTFVFSGVVVTEAFYNNNHPGVMLIPWILWGLVRPFRSRALQTVFLATLFGLDFLVGDPFTMLIAVVAAVLWILLEIAEPSRKGVALMLGVSLALASLLALPQIVATLLWIPETNRGVLGMPLGEVFLYSISPFRLLEFLIPFPFGDAWTIDHRRIWALSVFNGRAFGFFSSFYAGALAVIALATMGRRRPAGARFARGLFLAGLLVAVPGSLLPLRWRGLPSLIPLRYPEKFGVALVFALAIYCALAFDAFRLSGRRPGWILATGALFALLAVGIRLFPDWSGSVAVAMVGGQDEFVPVAARLLPEAIAEAGLLWMATVIALDLLPRKGRASLGVALALLTAVPILANRRIAQTFPEEALFAPTPFERFIRRADPTGAFRTLAASPYRPLSTLETEQAGNDQAQLEYCRRNWNQFMHCLWRRGTVFNDDFDNGNLSRLNTLRNISQRAAGFMDAGVFFGAISLRWGIRFRDQIRMPGFHRVRGDALMDWDEHERAYPDIRLLTSWREETGGLPAAYGVPRLTAGQIVIESGTRRLGTARPGRLRILEKSPERLRLEADAPDPTWLFVLRDFWNHRMVLLDGRPAEDFPAQIAFSAIRVPAGHHRIEWRELVPGGSVSRWGPVVFVLVAAVLVASERRRSRSR
jgi:hypothetical protein